jgi:putative endonuclease
MTGRPDRATRSPQPARQIAFRLGLSAEARAALLLRVKGYRILARRWQSRAGEIDLVARRGATVVFVEVKARGALEEAAAAVTVRQQRRIAAAAAAWLARHPAMQPCALRFDVILVVPRRWPRHIEDAFRPLC